MSYFCEKCGRNHKADSKIGIEHTPRAEPPAAKEVATGTTKNPPQPAGGGQPNQAGPVHPEIQPGGAAPQFKTAEPIDTTMAGPPTPPQEEAEAQLKLLAEALGIDKLAAAVKSMQTQIVQVQRHQGEILQGAAPTQPGLDLTKYGVTPETIQKGVKMIMDTLLGGGGGEDEELVRAIVAEEKSRKAALMKTKVKLIYDAINNDLPLYAGEAPPGPLTPKKDGDKK